MQNKSSVLPRFIAVIIAIVAVLVMIGWVFDVVAFKSIVPGWVEMKFITALMFFVVAIIIFYVSEPVSNENRNLFISFFSIFILLNLILLGLGYVGIDTAIGTLFVPESADAIKTVTPGYPSVGTMIGFLLVVTYGFISFNITRHIKILRLMAGAISFIGVLAIFGYAVNVPILYYYIENASNAIAVNTAILLVFVGVGLWPVSIDKQ